MLKVLYILSFIFFTTSILIPMFTIEQFYLFENKISLTSSIFALFENHEILLTLILTLFTIIIPYYKLFLLFEIIFLKNLNKKKLQRNHSLNKWAMIDVYIIANLFVIIKVTKLIDIQLHLGFYLLITTLILNILLTQFSQKKLNN